ncbi:MAG: hypothetical protein KDD40_03275 [Bdellovibrionales bacterium]|nr:hypothetical protein [Bdellovibrionales bacterium]
MKHNYLMLLLLFGFSLRIWAYEMIQGKIVATSPNLQIELTDGSNYYLFTESDSLKDDLARLQIGDKIHFQGRKQNNCIQLILFEHIDLQGLLDTWQSQNWYFFTFKPLGELTIYNPFTDNNELEKFFSYTIYPGTDDRWTIVLSGEDTNKVGYLQLLPQQAHLTLLHQDKPHSEEVYDLHRVLQ